MARCCARLAKQLLKARIAKKVVLHRIAVLVHIYYDNWAVAALHSHHNLVMGV